MEPRVWRIECGWCNTKQHDECRPRIEHKEQRATSICVCAENNHNGELKTGGGEAEAAPTQGVEDQGTVEVDGSGAAGASSVSDPGGEQGAGEGAGEVPGAAAEVAQ